MAYTIRVNGTDHTVDVDGDTPLLWVLRDTLAMTGTKFGCGIAACGACTVHLDGVATRSCITTIESVGKAAIKSLSAGLPGMASWRRTVPVSPTQGPRFAPSRCRRRSEDPVVPRSSGKKLFFLIRSKLP